MSSEGTCLIALVRHGETPWTEEGRLQGRSDVSLSRSGQEQAEALGRRLARETWDALYTSPLARARQTAEAITRHTGLVARVDEGLIERDFGALSGLTRDERWRRFPEDAVIPGLETGPDLLRRGLDTLARLARRHPGGRVIAVSHGAMINAVLRARGGAPMPAGGPGERAGGAVGPGAEGAAGAPVGRVQVAAGSVSLVRHDGNEAVPVGDWAG